MSSRGGGLMVLLRADLRRLAAVARRPSAAVLVGVVLPLLVMAAALRAVGSLGSIDTAGSQGGVTLGVLLGAPMAFLAYGTLFRGGDDAFLRRLGVAPGALFWERALRLLAWGLGLVILAVLAYSRAGAEVGPVLTVAVAAMVAAWGGALLSSAWSARAMANRVTGESWGCLMMGMWDREVAGAAPLVYAPLVPLMAGALAGGVAAGVDGGAAELVILVLGGGGAWVGSGAYSAALPRFAPQALEMSFAPPPEGGGEGLRSRRGLAWVLPRRAGAAWARDGAVASRRFAWASRVTWPVVVFSLVALARWGSNPDTRTWVVSAAAMVLMLQAAAAIGLGRMERRGPRWLDRAVGISPVQRFVGRWAWGYGLSLWMAVPLAMAWSWWAEAGPGWPWLAVGATSALGAVASGAAAGRR